MWVRPGGVTTTRRAQANARRSPDDPAAIGELGILYFVQGLPLAAATCFRQAAELAQRLA